MPDPKNKNGSIIVLSAASGAGKSTLIDHLRRSIPQLLYSVSATTRKPRSNEQDGVHYYFLTVGQFQQRIKNNEFAEWQRVHGNYYGTPRRFIDDSLSSGKSVVLDIDVYGKVKLDSVYPHITGILIVPPSLEVLEQRLRKRGTDAEKDIIIRLENAKKEMEFGHNQGNYAYTIVNDDLARAQQEIVAYVTAAIGDHA
ncbi:MAG: guanylate kinase [Chitinivibrionales bacterium]|nr:guanylate kinase [Chitinivibrionales bacterium]